MFTIWQASKPLRGFASKSVRWSLLAWILICQLPIPYLHAHSTLPTGDSLSDAYLATHLQANHQSDLRLFPASMRSSESCSFTQRAESSDATEDPHWHVVMLGDFLADLRESGCSGELDDVGDLPAADVFLGVSEPAIAGQDTDSGNNGLGECRLKSMSLAYGVVDLAELSATRTIQQLSSSDFPRESRGFLATYLTAGISLLGVIRC